LQPQVFAISLLYLAPGWEGRDEWRSRIESAKAFDQVREARDVGWEQVRTKRVWLHCHSAPKTGLVTACGRTAATPPASVKTSAMTPRMNFIVHSSGLNVQSSYMRSHDHCPKLQPVHDPSIRRDYVVMIDGPFRQRAVGL
jgi:hypothetical protein